MTRPSLAVLFVALAGLAACDRTPPSTAPKAVAGPPFVVADRDVDDLKPVAAVVTSYKMAEATSRLEGTLVVLKVREGDMVRRGQVIGVVEDSRIAPQTGVYSAQVVAAQALAVQARADYGRTKTLFDKGFYAQSGLDRAEAAMKSADAAVIAAKAQTETSSAYGGQGVIASPDDGKVVKADVPRGTVVMIGQSIATITSGVPVVRVQVPEAESRMLKVGQRIRLEADGRTGTGSLSRIYPSVTQAEVTADVTPAGFESLPVGSRVTAYITVGQRHAIVVPARFVTTRYGMDFVRLVQPGGATMETTVETAPYDSASIEVIGGLNPGDRISSYGDAR